jgi:mono/diheme cytochrome c family protein
MTDSLHKHALKALSTIALMVFTSGHSFAQDFDPGRALYENHCQQCHAGWVHTREGRKVTRLDDLHARVGAWSVHAGLHWTGEEIEAVTRYVNRRFYQLTE